MPDVMDVVEDVEQLSNMNDTDNKTLDESDDENTTT